MASDKIQIRGLRGVWPAKVLAIMPVITAAEKIRNFLTLEGMLRSSKLTVRGRFSKTAIDVDESRVAVTTIGIDLINSPMMPVESKSGTKAQTVVSVVVQRGTTKSRKTSMPVSWGEKRLEYLLTA